MTILTQGGSALLIQGGSDEVLAQGGGNAVAPPVTIIKPGDLGKSSYPTFFPCATWEFSQPISGNMNRTQFDSGWVRQRKRWRENVSGVNLAFEMNTEMFDRWATWMTNNGYDWFTMPLERYDGVQVIAEVRLIAPINYTYQPYDNVVCTVPGELGKYIHDYGPQDGPLTGTPEYGNFCVPVIITNQWQTIENANAGANIAFNVVVNTDATQPLDFAWYEDGVLIPGENGASYTYTVPLPDDPIAGGSTQIAVNATNACGNAWNRATVEVPPDTACQPYACDALMIDMVSIEGTGAWDLLDGNDEPNIPVLWDQKSEYLPGVGLTCTDAGNPWDSSTGVSRTTLNVGTDLDLCEGPYCATNGWNSQGTPSSWFLTPTQKWGGILPNGSIAAVVRGVRAHTSTPENHFFRGSTEFRTYTQTGDTALIGFDNDIRCGTRIVDSIEYDALWFNYGEQPSERQFAILMPYGTFTSGNTLLIEGSISITGIDYPASANQSYSKARYDMVVTCGYFGSVSDMVTGETYSGSQSVEFILTRTFETHDSPSLPLSDARKPYFTDTQNRCQYLQGGWGACYNLAVRHVHGGGSAGAVIDGGASPGRVSSGLEVAARRNYSDYEQPPYCTN